MIKVKFIMWPIVLRDRKRWRVPTPTVGRAVKDNHHTIWVQLANGDIIKRHKRRHHVELA